MFLLTITAANGRVSVVSFSTAFARALVMITLAGQPVTLTCAEYAA
jgi:hypothetical protein